MTALSESAVSGVDGFVEVAGSSAAADERLDLALVLQALSDPIRLAMVRQLADGVERTCGAVDVPVSRSTCSHHFRVLRECGLIETWGEGKSRMNRLRCEALETYLPGLLAVIVKASSR